MVWQGSVGDRRPYADQVDLSGLRVLASPSGSLIVYLRTKYTAYNFLIVDGEGKKAPNTCFVTLDKGGRFTAQYIFAAHSVDL